MTHDPSARVVEAFRRRFHRSPELLARAPGRVALLGAHVDYHEGWVLPGAIDRSVWVAASPRSDGRFVAVSEEFGGEADLDLGGLEPPDRPEWFHYPAGVAWAARRRGLQPVGLDAAVGSDLPAGAGVSSSAALEMAFALVWRACGLPIAHLELAELGREAENHFLGVGSGIMDQFASLAGRVDHLILLDCRDGSWSLRPLGPGLAVLVADSGVRRRLVDSAFGDRRTEGRTALDRLRAAGFVLRTLRDLPLGDLERAEGLLSHRLGRRVRHVVEECERVRAGARALAHGDLSGFAALVRASHESSRSLYEVSLPELDLLAEVAWGQPGCLGARLAGGGFGGCVSILVEATRSEQIADAVATAFAARFGRLPPILHCRIGDGASLVRPGRRGPQSR